MATKKTSWGEIVSLLFSFIIALGLLFFIGLSAFHGYWTQGIFWTLLYVLHRDVVTKRLERM